MRKPKSPVFHPVGGLAVTGMTTQSIRLKSRTNLVELSALTPDLFRLRITRDKDFSPAPSWAVGKADRPAVAVKITQTPGQVALETFGGRLTLDTREGGWNFSDSGGNSYLAAKAKATGFIGGEARTTVSLGEQQSIFGLGETSGTFNKRGLIREFWNIDVLGHGVPIHPSLRNLYVSIPFAISLREGRAAGIFWDNPARQIWDLGQTHLDQWQMTAESGEIELYLFAGPEVARVVSTYTELTGRTPLPPLWALGYQQCRYSYETRARFEEIARNFRQRKIPCDVLYLDIHHMDGYRVFTFGKTYPKPAEMIKKLARQGFKVVTIVDPGVKDDPKFGVLKRGRAETAFIKKPNGRGDYIGEVWPGKARFPDFLRASVREWWGREQNTLLKTGVAGFWNDMNEPANFALKTKTLLLECRHQTDAGPMIHAAAHNLYGMQMARASREGALAHQPDKRPFVITRAGYAGVQRHGLVWTGDNNSTWEHLADSVQMLLNLSVSGVAFCGSDAGGFMDNTTPELLTRWMQLAAFTPFFRNHSNLGTIDQEPWAFGANIENICRRYIELRYQLLPYLYSLFVEAHQNGTPIMRPLLWHYQDDPIAVAAGDQFMLGRDLLIAPVLRQGARERMVYLPRGIWFNFWTGERHEGGQHIITAAPLDILPIFARAAAIIPLAPIRQFVGEKRCEIVDLHVFPGASGEFNWHEDDGLSMGRLSGDFHDRKISATVGVDGGEIHFAGTEGKRASEVKQWRVVLRNSPRDFVVTVNGREIVSHYDAAISTGTFEFANSGEAIDIKLT